MALKIALPDPNPLKDPLHSLGRQPLGLPCKLAIMNEFWGDPNASFNWSKSPIDTYFEYYEDQSRLALHSWDRYDVSSLNFGHVIKIATMVQQGKTRAEMDAELKSTTEGDCPGLSSEIIDLTVRLLLMIQIGGFRNVLMPGQETLAWADGPLSDSLTMHFTRDNVLKVSVDLDKTFTARNIERIAGIRIVWTNNLLDHLRMRDDDTSVALFHHASFLNFQKDWYVDKGTIPLPFQPSTVSLPCRYDMFQLPIDCPCSALFPEGLVEETIKTLSLLLPMSDREATSWFLKQQIELRLDNEAVRCKTLTKEERSIDNFAYVHPLKLSSRYNTHLYAANVHISKSNY